MFSTYLYNFSLQFPTLTTNLGKTGTENDYAFDALLNTLIQHLEYDLIADGNQQQIRRFRQAGQIRIALDTANLFMLGVNRVYFPLIAMFL
jgi:hypothetical protein